MNGSTHQLLAGAALTLHQHRDVAADRVNAEAQPETTGPEPERMIEAHAEIVARARAHMVEKDLMSLPWKESLEVITRQQTPGANPYYGDFSGAASRPLSPPAEASASLLSAPGSMTSSLYVSRSLLMTTCNLSSRG